MDQTLKNGSGSDLKEEKKLYGSDSKKNGSGSDPREKNKGKNRNRPSKKWIQIRPSRKKMYRSDPQEKKCIDQTREEKK